MASLLKAWKVTVVGIECGNAAFFPKKAWKVTVVGIECNGTAFLTSFQEGPHQKLFFKDFFKILQDDKLYYIVDIVNHLIYYWQTLSNSMLISLKYGVMPATHVPAQLNKA